ncbi:ABC transporter substrate-binding protein [Thermodesulfovibrionales bacterium]|nr:ABC transporter substrate-binding protein [Thermodesulfovibrionales bacterium]
MKMNRKIAGLAVCLLLLSSMLAVWVGQQAEEGKVEVPQEVVAGLGRDAGGVYGAAHHHPPLTRLFEMLVTTGFEAEIIPQLATSWEISDDGLTWTFYLREGVKFHDGTPFNAEAAKFSLEMHNERRPGHLGPIASIEAVDEYILQITHTEPFAPLLHQLRWPLFSMASPAAFDEEGNIVNPIGTGPFKEEEWIPGERLVLVRNEDYWGGMPKLERIILKHIPDDTTRVMALEAGEIDMIIDVGGVPPEHAKALENNPEIEIITKPITTVRYLIFNNQKPPFDDVRIRQAIQYAIDQKSIIQFALEGFGVPTGSVVAPSVVDWHNRNTMVEHDFEMAKQLLNEAGWADTDGDNALDKNGKEFRVSLIISPRWPAPTVAEIIQGQLHELGLIVEIQVLERGVWRDAIRAGEHDMTIHALSFIGPHNALYRSFHSEGDLNLGRGIFYSNSRVDELTELGKVTMARGERQKIYMEVQEIVAEEVPVVPIFAEVMINAVRHNIEGYKPNPWFTVNWEDIYVVAP